jgi:hypothetical protein
MKTHRIILLAAALCCGLFTSGCGSTFAERREVYRALADRANAALQDGTLTNVAGQIRAVEGKVCEAPPEQAHVRPASRSERAAKAKRKHKGLAELNFAREAVNGVVTDSEQALTASGAVLAETNFLATSGCRYFDVEPGLWLLRQGRDPSQLYDSATFHDPEQLAGICYDPGWSPVPWYVQLVRLGD